MNVPHTLIRDAAVLLAVRDAGETYGGAIAAALSLPSSTVYRALHRLTRAGLLSVRKEGVDPSDLHRPARLYYRVLGEAAPIVDTVHALHRLAEERQS
jgi:DNA-binding IclR family transcriptional regulator